MDSQHQPSPHQADRPHCRHILPHEYVNDTFFDQKPAWQYRLEKDQLAPPDNASELTRNASVRSTSSHLSQDSGYSTVPPSSSTCDPCEPLESPWRCDFFPAEDDYSQLFFGYPSKSSEPRRKACRSSTYTIASAWSMDSGIEIDDMQRELLACEHNPKEWLGSESGQDDGRSSLVPRPPSGPLDRRAGSEPPYQFIRGESIDSRIERASKQPVPAHQTSEDDGEDTQIPDIDAFQQSTMELRSIVAGADHIPSGESSLVSTRVPSPWQQAANLLLSEQRRINEHLSRSLEWILSRNEEEDDDEPVQQTDPEPSSSTSPHYEPSPLPSASLPPSHECSKTEGMSDLSSDIDSGKNKISDLAERKIIQNRIAQRCYRKKLKRRLEDLERPARSPDSAVWQKIGSPTTETHVLAVSKAALKPPEETAPSNSIPQFTAPMESNDEFFLPDSYDNRERSQSSLMKRFIGDLSTQVPDDQNSKRRRIGLVLAAESSTNHSLAGNPGQSDDPGSTSSNQHSDTQSFSNRRVSSGQMSGTNPSRANGNGGPGRGNEDEDAGSRPPRPPNQPVSPPYDSLRHSKRPRYACPYNKWDPIGCQLCCMPSRKNPEGGAEVFSRVKSHIFRNHDISVRCKRCWASFPTKSETLEDHVHKNACMRKASPTKYWMTEDQRRQVRGQRFVGSGEENWYHLFRILLPDAPVQDDHGGYILTPYYVPLAESRTPSNLSGPASQTAGSGIPAPISGLQTPNGQGVNSNPMSYLSNAPQLGEPAAITDDTWCQIPPFIYDADTAVIDDTLVSITSHPNEDVGVSSIDLYPTPRTRRHSDESGESGSGHVFSHRRNNSGNERQPVPQAPQDASSTFLQLDNERLRLNMRQLRTERDDMRRRMEAANSRVDCLEQLLEDALYEEGKSSKLCSKLFELSKTLVDLRKELG